MNIYVYINTNEIDFLGKTQVNFSIKRLHPSQIMISVPFSKFKKLRSKSLLNEISIL